MATNLDFKIRQGLSSELFEQDGITPRAGVKLELGCWYLCIDTVCVYVCVKKDQSLGDTAANKILKKVNAATFDAFEERLEAIENQPRYIEIKNECELPKDFKSPDFNPNIAYYIITDPVAKFMSLYVFDAGSQCYVCTNKADLSTLEAKIDDALNKRFDATLDSKLTEKVPGVVKTTLETQILFGGKS